VFGDYIILYLSEIVKCFLHKTCSLEVINIYELFREKIKHVKVDKKYTNADIAKLTGYKTKAIEAFMCGARSSSGMANAIAQALKIEM